MVWRRVLDVVWWLPAAARVCHQWRALRHGHGLAIQRRNPDGGWQDVRRWPRLDPIGDADAILRAEVAQWERSGWREPG
jgi:hypothetical protein